jgi:Retrotransposon gag protein/Zinc knuckle
MSRPTEEDVGPLEALRRRVAELEVALHAPRTVAKPPKPEVFRGKKGVATWLYTVEKYFNALHVNNDASRLEYVVTLLQGPAANWWRMLEDQTNRGGPELPSTWEEFKDAAITQFQPLAEERSARLKLERMSQTGSDHDYVKTFSDTVLLIPAMDEGTRLQFFEHGLKPGVKKWVRQQRPSTLLEAMSYAEEYDASDFQDKALDRALQRQFQPSTKPTCHDGATPMELGYASGQPRSRTKTAPSGQNGLSRKVVTCWKCGKPGHRKFECRCTAPSLRATHVELEEDATREEN